MSVASINNRNNYTGDGANNTYDYTYRIFTDDDLTVTVKNTAGVETTLVKTTDYTVTDVGIGAGGTIILVSSGQAWLTGANLTTAFVISIRRVKDLTQNTDIRNQGDYFPETIEDEFDRSRMIDQQQQDEIDRSAKLPETVDPSTFNASLPATLVGANKRTFTTNAAGDAFEVGPSSAEIESAEVNAVLAEAWANKVDGVVASSEYSSKAYAIGGTGVTNTATKGAAKEWAITAEDSTVDGTGYSALHHAAKASGSATSAAASLAAISAAIPFKDVVYLTSADSPYTVIASQAGTIFNVDAASGAVTINLPSIAAVTSTPKMFGFIKTDAGSNVVTLARNGTDTIAGATTLSLDVQNAGSHVVADTDAAPDDWTALNFGAAGGGGGGVDVEWYPQDNAPMGDTVSNTDLFRFEDAIDQNLYAEIRIPDSYVVGNQINLKGQFATSVTSGTVLFDAVSTLIRVGTDAFSSTTNQHSSTNTAITVNGTTNVLTEVIIDLSDGSGQINSTAVAAGSRIKINLTRDTTTDTAAADALLMSKGWEVTLS